MKISKLTHPLKDQTGFTIVEVVVAGAIMMVAIGAALSTMQTNMRVQSSAVSGTDVDRINTQAVVALGDLESCMQTFDGVPFPTGATPVQLDSIKRMTKTGPIDVITRRSAPATPSDRVYVSDIRLYSNSEVELVYTRTGEGILGGDKLFRRVTAPITWNGTKIVCAQTNSNVDIVLKATCESNGGFYDAAETNVEDRCKRCPAGQYNSAPAGSPLTCELLAKKTCESMGGSIAYWEDTTKTCHTCPAAGQILKKPTGGAPFSVATNCVDSIDQPSFNVALNCVPPQTAVLKRDPATGAITGECVGAPPPPNTQPSTPPSPQTCPSGQYLAGTTCMSCPVPTVPNATTVTAISSPGATTTSECSYRVENCMQGYLPSADKKSCEEPAGELLCQVNWCHLNSVHTASCFKDGTASPPVDTGSACTKDEGGNAPCNKCSQTTADCSCYAATIPYVQFTNGACQSYTEWEATGMNTCAEYRHQSGYVGPNRAPAQCSRGPKLGGPMNTRPGCAP